MDGTVVRLVGDGKSQELFDFDVFRVNLVESVVWSGLTREYFP